MAIIQINSIPLGIIHAADFIKGIKIIPKGSPGKINYIKKEKRKDIDNYDEIVKFLAKRFEISKREVQQYIDSGQVDISNIKAALK